MTDDQGYTVLICGGRDLDSRRASGAIARYWRFRDRWFPDTVLHGGARGADAAAGMWAEFCGVPCIVFEAEWQTHGRAAGPIRNQRMLDEGCPDLVLALWDGESRGTQDMIRRAVKAGVQTAIVPARNLK